MYGTTQFQGWGLLCGLRGLREYVTTPPALPSPPSPAAPAPGTGCGCIPHLPTGAQRSLARLGRLGVPLVVNLPGSPRFRNNLGRISWRGGPRVSGLARLGRVGRLGTLGQDDDDLETDYFGGDDTGGVPLAPTPTASPIPSGYGYGPNESGGVSIYPTTTSTPQPPIVLGPPSYEPGISPSAIAAPDVNAAGIPGGVPGTSSMTPAQLNSVINTGVSPTSLLPAVSAATLLAAAALPNAPTSVKQAAASYSAANPASSFFSGTTAGIPNYLLLAGGGLLLVMVFALQS